MMAGYCGPKIAYPWGAVMGFFDWRQDYSVGVRVIDQQHKRLVFLINELFQAMQTGKGSQSTGEVLKGLVDYTRSHFRTEEDLMKTHGYPGFLAHKKEHDDLTGQAVELLRESQEGRLTVALDTSRFLKEWLATHILGTDKRLGGYLTRKGVI
jgi:hemerythrin